MAKDIIEDVLGAIDIISQAKLNDMKFNKTDLCTIEKVVNKEKGEYLVASGAMKYTAWAQGETTYREGNSVYVLVPNGDYNAEKIIVGRYSASDSRVVETLSPLDVVMNMSGELVSEKREKKLIANGNTIELPITIDTETSFTGYDSICMVADFKTNIVANAGSYGLKLVIKYEDEDKETEFYLDSSDMVGDPYAFDSYFNQVKGFVLDPKKTFKVIGLSFYQLKDFMDFENQPLTKTEENLFVKNVSVSLGINIENYTDDRVMLFVDGDQSYTLKNTNAVINLKWVHWTGSRAIVIKSLEDEAIKDLDVDIHWYRYNIGNKNKDPLLGECFWDEVKPSNLFQYSINDLNKDWKEEKFKVWIEYGAAIYKSEEIVLSNLDGKHIDMSSGFIDGIYIKFPSEDRYKGKFYIYGEDLSADTLSYNRVLNKVSVDYRVNETAYDPWDDAEITINWKIPVGDTMFIEPEDGKEYKSSNWIIQKEDKENKKEEIRGEDVIVLPKSKAGAAAVEFKGRTFEPLNGYYQILRTAKNKDQAYRIKKDYNNTFKSNTLSCEVWRNGVLYNASQEFLFGVFGTNGTNYTFTVEIEEYGDKDEDGNDVLIEKEPIAITLGITKKWKFIPHIADYEHKTVEIDVGNFGVEIFSHNAPSENEIKKYYTITNKELVVANNPLDNRYGIILKFTYKINDELTLSRYQPVAVRADKKYAYIYGADRVLYKSDGLNPKWNKSVYKLALSNNSNVNDSIIANVSSLNRVLKNINSQLNDVEDGSLEKEELLESKIIVEDTLKQAVKSIVIWNINNYKDEFGYYPKLLNDKLVLNKIELEDEILTDAIYNKYLDAPRMYMQNQKGEYPLITVYASSLDGKCQWLQPILVSTDPYGSTFFNNWDGKLKIDENNDTILAATIGAGIKNDDNTFSGAVMGELKSASNSSKNKTGILGFDHGVESFGFLTDGSAFIGKPGVGRINFDGNHGYIMSNNFNGFNGESGTLPIYDENNKEKFDFKNKEPQGTYLGLTTGNSYFAGTIYSGAGRIGGWNIQDITLCSDDEKAAYLYSTDQDVESELILSDTETKKLKTWRIKVSDKFGVDKDGNLYAASISTLNSQVSKIETDYLAADQVITDTLRAEYIAADKIVTDKINTDILTVNTKITAANGRIDKIASDYITTSELEAHKIKADKIDGGTITGVSFKVGSTKTGSGRLISSANDSVYVYFGSDGFSFMGGTVYANGGLYIAPTQPVWLGSNKFKASELGEWLVNKGAPLF